MCARIILLLGFFGPTSFFLGIPAGRTILVSCFFFSVPPTQKNGSAFDRDTLQLYVYRIITGRLVIHETKHLSYIKGIPICPSALLLH